VGSASHDTKYSHSRAKFGASLITVAADLSVQIIKKAAPKRSGFETLSV
jgi:hypothetical protein